MPKRAGEDNTAANSRPAEEFRGFTCFFMQVADIWRHTFGT